MKQRVLVVEDDDDLRDLVGDYLGEEFAVTLAQDGREAIQIITGDGEAVDAVVADLEMPGMDGASMINELRRRGIDVPILITSGKPDGARWARDFDADFLPKPFHFDELRQHLEIVLRRRPPEPSADPPRSPGRKPASN